MRTMQTLVPSTLFIWVGHGMTLLHNANATAKSTHRLALKHQAQRTKEAEAP